MGAFHFVGIPDFATSEVYGLFVHGIPDFTNADIPMAPPLVGTFNLLFTRA
jgi:hypothetical protein